MICNNILKDIPWTICPDVPLGDGFTLLSALSTVSIMLIEVKVVAVVVMVAVVVVVTVVTVVVAVSVVAVVTVVAVALLKICHDFQRFKTTLNIFVVTLIKFTLDMYISLSTAIFF